MRTANMLFFALLLICLICRIYNSMSKGREKMGCDITRYDTIQQSSFFMKSSFFLIRLFHILYFVSWF